MPSPCMPVNAAVPLLCAFSPSCPSQLAAHSTHTPPCAQLKHGETFVSETDTEVIPKLCKFIYQGLRKTEGDKVPFSKVRV